MNDNLNDNLKNIQSILSSINKKMEKQDSRIDKLEQALGEKHVNKILEVKESFKAVKEENQEHKEILVETEKVLKNNLDQEKKESINIETAIGGKLFAKIGIVVLIISVSLFLKYAFDNWWGPWGRILTGLIVGAILLILGEKTIKKYSSYGQMLSGGGIVVLYLSIFAAFSFYNLISQTPAMLIMIAVTILSIFLSVKHNARSLMILSILGGFATPFLISTGENNYVGLFSYIILLDIAIMAVSFVKKWKENSYIGFLGSFLVYGLWIDKFYTNELLFPAMTFLTAFFIIYSISLLLYNLVKKEASGQSEQIMIVIVALAYFGAAYKLMDAQYHDFMGLFSFIMATYYLISAFLIAKITKTDQKLRDILIVLGTFFVTIGFLVQFDNYLITISWVVEAALITFIGVRHKSETLKLIGFIILILAIFRNLAFDIELYTSQSMIFMNKVFVTSLFLVLTTYIISFFFLKYQKDEDRESMFTPVVKTVAVFMILANLLTIYAIDREIITYYKYEKLEAARMTQSECVEAKSSILNPICVNDLHDSEALFLGLSWALYGLILVVSGFIKKFMSTKVLGVILVFIAIIQMLFYGLWFLEDSYRIILSVTVIIVSYLLLFLYKKYGEEKEKYMPLVFGILANLMTILFISREIRDYYLEKTRLLADKELMTQVLREQIKGLKNKGSIMLSIFWLVYGIGLTTIGIIFKKRSVRIGAILLLLTAIVKLFFYDLWYLGTLYRIISSICLSLVLLSISYVYHKYADKIKEVI